MVSLCFDPSKEKCTGMEGGPSLKPELQRISKKKANLTVVLYFQSAVSDDGFFFLLPFQATAGDEFQKHHLRLE